MLKAEVPDNNLFEGTDLFVDHHLIFSKMPLTKRVYTENFCSDKTWFVWFYRKMDHFGIFAMVDKIKKGGAAAVYSQSSVAGVVAKLGGGW